MFVLNLLEIFALLIFLLNVPLVIAYLINHDAFTELQVLCRKQLSYFISSVNVH